VSDKDVHCYNCPLYQADRIEPGGDKGAKILLVGECPSQMSPRGGMPFSDREGSSISMALKRINALYKNAPDGETRWNNIGVHRIYSVQCIGASGRNITYKPKKTELDKCRLYLDETIAHLRPTAIITFGALALRNLVREKIRFDDLRGVQLTRRLKTVSDPEDLGLMNIFPTFSAKAILAKPGLFDEMVRDMRKAFLFAEGRGTVEVYKQEYLRECYDLPHTVEEVRKLCQYIIDYSNPGADPGRHLLSVDTETDTLEPHDPTAKLIAISFGWAQLKAATILLDHPNAPWTPEEAEQVKYHVKRVLACAKPKVFHNYQFDRKFIFQRYGWHIENVIWDTMGGEHLIEEDKKGEYKLKHITRTRLPRYAGYEDKVADLREEHGGKTRADEGKRLRKAQSAYEVALNTYKIKMDQYDVAFALYSQALATWTAKRLAEKVLAKSEKRKMDQEVIGKKPRKPLKPKPPKVPEAQEPFDFTMIPVDDLEVYAAVDADVTRQHVLHQNKRMAEEFKKDTEERRKYNDPPPKPVRALMGSHVIPTSVTLAQVEFTGFPVDMPYVEELDSKLAEVVRKTEQELYEMAGGKFVIGNPREITRILFQSGFMHEGTKVRVPITDKISKTPTGQLKADETALKYIKNTYEYDFPGKVLEYRKAAKARSPFLTNVREHARFDGRMHASFHLTGTGTGRLSSSNENLQNIPKELAGFLIKKIFIPPEGHVLVNTDAKGAEVRIFAAYSRDEQLIEAIVNGLDAHSFFASKVWNENYEAIEMARDICDAYEDARRRGEHLNVCSEEQYKAHKALVKKRTKCKRVVFGTLYGAMAPKIAETAGISLDEAQEVIDLMFEMFPSIPEYIDSTNREVLLYGAVQTWTGRKRRFPISGLRSFRNRCQRQAVNFKIQSTASDVVMWVINKIRPIITNDMQGELHATVHDSLVFSVPQQYTTQIKDLMYEYGTLQTKEAFPWMTVPFLWDVEAGPSYGEVVGIDKYIEGHTHDKETTDQKEAEVDNEIRTEFTDFA